MSLLADAAEEMTFAADTTNEFELDERNKGRMKVLDAAIDYAVKAFYLVPTMNPSSPCPPFCS